MTQNGIPFSLKCSKDHVIVQLGIELTLEFHQITVTSSLTTCEGHTNLLELHPYNKHR